MTREATLIERLPTFDIGEEVVHGSDGVCSVVDISTINIEGVPPDRLYYILRSKDHKDGLIYVPYEKGGNMMRPALDAKQAGELIASIPDIELLPYTDDRSREQLYRKCIKSRDCRCLVSIIKTLYIRNRDRVATGRKASMLDERYLRQAEEIIYAELSNALGIPEEEMREYIGGKIERS